VAVRVRPRDEAECEGSECTQAWLQRNAAACGGDETILFGQPATDGNPEIYSLFGQGCEVQCEDKTYSDSELERQKKTCKCQTDKGGSAVKSAFSVFVDRDNDDFGDDDSSDDDEYNRDDIEFECECATAKVSQCQCEGHGCSSTAFRQCLEYSSCPVELFDPQNGDVQCQTDEDYDDYYSDADDDGFYDSISDDNGFDDDGYFDQDFDDFDISDDNGFDD